MKKQGLFFWITFLVLFLIFTFTSIVLAAAYINNKPIPNQAAQTLRDLFGTAFVKDLEKGGTSFVDELNRFTEIDPSETNQQALNTLDSDANYPTIKNFSWISLLHPKVVELFSVYNSMKSAEFLDQSLISENKNVLRKLSNIDENVVRFIPPEDITPIIVHPKLDEEGEWSAKTIGRNLFYTTAIRPDFNRPWATVDLCRFDPERIPLHLTMGYEHQDLNGKTGPGVIDDGSKKKLIAAFNGGFLPAHDNGGMIIDYELKKPLQPDKGTIIIFEDGSVALGQYSDAMKQTIETSKKRIRYARQNLAPLIIDHKVNYHTSYWGITLKDSDPVFAHRSGIGITEEGFLIYAVGKGVSAQTIAYALKMAGCVNAMHLDMNASNVTFSFYLKDGDGKLQPERLGNNCWGSLGQHYLGRYSHDFFYLVSKD